jgi:hypothetical protein
MHDSGADLARFAEIVKPMSRPTLTGFLNDLAQTLDDDPPPDMQRFDPSAPLVAQIGPAPVSRQDVDGLGPSPMAQSPTTQERAAQGRVATSQLAASQPAGTNLGALNLPLGLLVRAHAMAARLDEALDRADPALRAGWIERAAIREAVACGRLDGIFVTPGRLIGVALEAEPDDMRPLPEDYEIAGRLTLLRSLLRPQAAARRPWTVVERALRRIAHRRATYGDPALRNALALFHSMDYTNQPALVGAFVLARDLTSIDPKLARRAALLWAQRPDLAGGTRHPCFCFEMVPIDWHRHRDAGAIFLRAAEEAAHRGLNHLTRLERLFERMAGIKPGNARSRTREVARLLISRPGLSAKFGAARLGLSIAGFNLALTPLRRAGLARDLSGRRSYRVWAADL